jgi:hypothetical protein
MKRFATAVSIHARPETIWALLTDAVAYPQMRAETSANMARTS